jgi:hypothetical protein
MIMRHDTSHVYLAILVFYSQPAEEIRPGGRFALARKALAFKTEPEREKK